MNKLLAALSALLAFALTILGGVSGEPAVLIGAALGGASLL